jgi:hypothetical protein
MFFRCGSIKKKCAILEKKKSPENRQWWGWWPSARLPSPGLSSLNTVWPARLFLYSPSLFSTMGPVVERKHLQHTHRHVDCCCLFSRRNQISQVINIFTWKNFSPLLLERDRKNIRKIEILFVHFLLLFFLRLCAIRNGSRTVSMAIQMTRKKKR